MGGRRQIFIMAAVLCTALVLTSCGGSAKQIRFGTAGTGGNYYTFGQAFAEILTSEGKNLKPEVKVTAGSAANLRLLSGKYIQMALAQTDVINDAWTATGTFAGKDEQRGYSAVAGLYTEACQVVTAEGSGIQTIRDLRGKKISIGEEESGTMQNAEQILLAYGLNDKMTSLVNMSYTEAADALKSGEIDAFFCTAGVQTAVVEELAQEIPIRLLSVDSTEQENLTDIYDYYLPYVIPAGTYTGQEEEIETIGVRSVLLASDKLDQDTVRQVTELLFAHSDKLEAALPVDYKISPETAVDGIPIPFHKGAAEYYVSIGIDVVSE